MELGWIDFSKTERSKVLSVLELLSQKGTLDELGIAPVRDGFSNIFFPGTSTIQTHAKYFLIIPYALRDLEKTSETNPNRLLKALDDIEKTCGQILVDESLVDDGIIGKRAISNNSWVKRAPSDIYWSGLKKYGIYIGGNHSLSEYARALCVAKSRKTPVKKLGSRNDNAEEFDCDDSDAGNIGGIRFWNISTYKDNWKETLSMRLTAEESAYLKNQIITHCPESLLAYILKNNMTEVLNYKSFAELNEGFVRKLPEHFQDYYYAALKFSDFIYFLRVLYNIIISDGKNIEANEEYQRLLPRISNIAGLNLDYIMDLFAIYTNLNLKSFLYDSQNLMLAGDIDGLKERIKRREVQLKPGRAKTEHPGEFEPVVWLGGRELDYRFGNAKIILRDIFESEAIYSAESK